jgi:flagellar motor switch/type III secretory pathway protein FliN
VIVTPGAIAAFPWSALERVARGREAVLRAARRQLERIGEPDLLAKNLEKLLGCEIEFRFRALTSQAPAHLVQLAFEVPGRSTTWRLGVEAGLASALLGALLRRPVTIVDAAAPIDPALYGALSALVIEAARGALASEPLSPALVPSSPAAEVVALATVLVQRRPYTAALWLPEIVAAPPAKAGVSLLRQLAGAEVSLPLVTATCVVASSMLRELVPGAAFCPGAAWTLAPNGAGRAILCAGQSERGIEVELGPSEKIVVRGHVAVAVAAEQDLPVENEAPSDAPTLADVVLDAPITVRVEVGQIAMPAREWAELRPGDVIGTGRRIAEPVVLRAAGHVLARGELVNLDGELAVRILELMPRDRE